MLTRYQEALIEYWSNWKPGMGIYKGSESNKPILEKCPEVKVEVDIDAEDIKDSIWDIL